MEYRELESGSPINVIDNQVLDEPSHENQYNSESDDDIDIMSDEDTIKVNSEDEVDECYNESHSSDLEEDEYNFDPDGIDSQEEVTFYCETRWFTR